MAQNRNRTSYLYLRGAIAGCALIGSASGESVAAEALEEIVVTGHGTNLIGTAQTASEGFVGQTDIEIRPLSRLGEVMELVPGMAATQHSGSGKANQYFLRGFNLDHGTDFATLVDHMPVNMRSHGHGQGYTDINFLIPELIDRLAYSKGPYYAELGDFSGAGGVHITSTEALDLSMLVATVGEHDYGRLLAANGWRIGTSDLLAAVEAQRYDGPWSDIAEDVERYNLWLKFGTDLGVGRLTATFMGYENDWNSADQIPHRAVAAGLIDDLGSLDPQLGGKSSRYSFSVAYGGDRWEVAGYAIDYALSLVSNFTYFLDDPGAGDQFEQVDKRTIVGGSGRYRFDTELGGNALTHTLGFDARFDDIGEVGLYRTTGRAQRLGAVRSDAVNEFSLGLYLESQYHATERLRATAAIRFDGYTFDVAPRIAVNVNGVDISGNAGERDADLFSAKGSLAYTFNPHWEAYAAAGQGLHSNDARGTVTRIDPGDGSAVVPVDPLVRSWGAEVGLRARWTDRFNASMSLWRLRVASELLFIGDAGTTEASRASRRQGLELIGYWRFGERWSADLEYARTKSNFTEPDPADPTLGDQIPGAVRDVLQAGISARYPNGLFGTVRLRHFGPRPLDEGNIERSKGATAVNLLFGYQWRRLALQVELLNLLDSRDHDVDYFYTSRLPGEPADGVDDLHFHVMEPRTFRLTARFRY